MANVSREDLKQYCLRRLGSPVIQINVEDSQLEDRIDDALEYFRDYHSDASEKIYKVVTITQTDIDNEEIALNDPLISSISRVINLSTEGVSAGEPGFSLEHQYVVNELSSFRDLDLVSYSLMKQKMGLIDRIFSVGTEIEFNRYKNTVKPYMDWTTIQPGSTIIVFEGYRYIDTAAATAIFNDRWLKRYCTALFKRQWGENLVKLTGVQLPGGVTIPGDKIFQEAVDEIEQLEKEMIDWYSDPVDFFIG